MFGRLLVILLVVAFAVGIVTRTSHGAGREQVYVVRPADTLWSIAQARYAGDPRGAILRVEQANHLGGPLIVPGQTLLLP